MKSLRITQFGNVVLRAKTDNVSKVEMKISNFKNLINNMYFTLSDKKLGIGLAATQVGESKRVAVINIQKTAVRPEVEEFKLTIINPEITKYVGRKTQMWEGCISAGAGRAGLFAKVPRYKKVELSYFDEKGETHINTYDGLVAQVIQHEVDHLNGVLFVDRVVDTKSYMTYSEYKKMKKTL